MSFKKISSLYYEGNLEILSNYKIGFLCSRKYPSNIVLESFDWALKMKKENKCVISGFQSPLEKDVLDILLKGSQPIIIVLARGLKKLIEPKIKKAIEENRVLVITQFEPEIKRITKENALLRNKQIIDLSDDIYIPYASKNGLLEKILKEKY
jgi:predicted Rossmann fold nucleotide-binding protein DprA/Smf involved in DNA uptake